MDVFKEVQVNLFGKNPKTLFQLIAALILVVLAFYLVLYFMSLKEEPAKIPESVVTPPTTRKEEPAIDYEQFGVVYMEVDSPSYAKSNFDVNPLTSLNVYFNEQVDTEDVAAKFSLIDEATEETVNVTVTSELRPARVEGESYAWKWQEVWEEKLIFTPVQELEPVTMYRAEVGPGYYNKEQEGTARSTYVFEFLTADEPGILNSSFDNKGFQVKKEDQMKIIFKSPVDEESVKEWFSLLPQADYDLVVVDKILTILNLKEPGNYTLRIPPQVEDIYGRVLGEEFVVEFELI
jgi:hypothetical protein